MRTMTFAALILAFSANAQIQPPNPTAADVVYLHISAPCVGFAVDPVVRNGFNIDVTLRHPGGACLTQVEQHEVVLGRLPAGSYTVTVRLFEGETLTSTQVTQFAVAPGAIVPALSAATLALLAAAMAVGGAVLLRR